MTFKKENNKHISSKKEMDLNKHLEDNEGSSVDSNFGDDYYIDEDVFLKELEDISDAIQSGNLNLSVDEKQSPNSDIQLISNALHQNNPLVNSNDDENSVNMEELNLDDYSNHDENSVNMEELNLDDYSTHDEKYDITIPHIDNSLESEKVFPDSNSDYESNHLSVDDALDDLITDYSTEIAIKVENVSMDYKLSRDKIDTFKEFFIRTLKRNKSKSKTIHALKDISFEIQKSDRVGIIGFNGAGKSTLLKLLAGVYDPTSGSIYTNGKIAPLLELGAGFDFNYTGKANIFLNGALLGFSEDFLKDKYDEIVEFSELGDAINYHVKTYSSGMRAKLGFSIATIVEPDILIIDEILSVGDIKFQRKSSDKIRSLINSGITVLLVSHSVQQIRDLCNKAIWIDNGELMMMGDVNKVCDVYVEAATNATSDQLKNIDLDN